MQGFNRGGRLAGESSAKRYIMTEYGYPETRAEANLMDMRRHPDILEEFIRYSNTFRFPPEKACISAAGYTAHDLSEGYGMSPLAAYNYLCFLLDDEDAAKKELEGKKTHKAGIMA